MTTADSILRQLAAEQTTPEAIGEKITQPPVVVAVYLCDLEKDGLATSHNLGDPAIGRKLVTWRITEKGKARAEELTAPNAEPQLALV